MKDSPLKVGKTRGRPKKEELTQHLDDTFMQHVARRNIIRSRILHILGTLDELPEGEEFSEKELNKSLGAWGDKFPSWVRSTIRNCLNIPSGQVRIINNLDR